MEGWVQNYDPLGNAWASTLLAAIPIVTLLALLMVGIAAHRAALAGLLMALAVAIAGYGMPMSAAIAAAGHGAAFGLLPISWIVLSAVFLYRLTVDTGKFEVLQRSVAAISPDHRIQALLIAFCFGSFIEGAAGFGTPVAISAALLLGLGFRPLMAAGLALIANTSPVAFGALGTPVIVLADVSGLDLIQLCQMAGRQLPLFSLLIPAWMIVTLSGWRGLWGCWPAVVVCGASFAILQALMSHWHGPTLVDVVGGLGSLASTTLFLRFWQPAQVWRSDPTISSSTDRSETTIDSTLPSTGSSATLASRDSSISSPPPKDSRREVMQAWFPWVLLSILVLIWGWPAFKKTLDGGPAEAPNLLQGLTVVTVKIPGLHGTIYRAPPVAKVPLGSDRAEKPESAEYRFAWLSTTGTGIFFAACLSSLAMQIPPRRSARLFLDTLWRLRSALVTIACMLALAYVTKASGADATLGLAFTRTGSFYPFFAPLLGWLGVALTGSDTSSNALFGSLQRITAEQLNLNPILIVASNSTGGVMGKMIDAQSIVVAAVATERASDTGAILRFVFWHSVALALLMGLLTACQAWFTPWMIPV